ncbi:hypothetical protein [Lacrimispora celerecrescens]|nr:hypothetical protein [Lacrimispora celerecrescens]
MSRIRLRSKGRKRARQILTENINLIKIGFEGPEGPFFLLMTGTA